MGCRPASRVPPCPSPRPANARSLAGWLFSCMCAFAQKTPRRWSGRKRKVRALVPCGGAHERERTGLPAARCPLGLPPRDRPDRLAWPLSQAWLWGLTGAVPSKLLEGTEGVASGTGQQAGSLGEGCWLSPSFLSLPLGPDLRFSPGFLRWPLPLEVSLTPEYFPLLLLPSLFHPFSLLVSWSPHPNSPPRTPRGLLRAQSGDKTLLSCWVSWGDGRLSWRETRPEPRKPPARWTPGPRGQEWAPSLTWSLSPLSPRWLALW